MGISFRAGEIFEMAIRIEENGAEFYRKAAGFTAEGPARSMLLGLAQMEEGHVKTFTQMKDALAGSWESELFDPEGDVIRYLRAAADGKVFDTGAAVLSGAESLDEILRRAIGLEEDSIAFYVGMKELVSEAGGKSRLDAIIREELGHIAQLSGRLSSGGA